MNAGSKLIKKEKKNIRGRERRELYRDNDRANDSLEARVEGRARRTEQTRPSGRGEERPKDLAALCLHWPTSRRERGCSR